jgi:hypothetical protein
MKRPTIFEANAFCMIQRSTRAAYVYACAGDHEGGSWWKHPGMQFRYLTICGSSDIPCS